MTAEEYAKTHAQCFQYPRPWSAAEFASLLQDPSVFSCLYENGFALGRVAGPEAELLTIAVAPNARGQGEGRQILENFIKSALHKSAQEIFLEVAEDNTSAITLYESVGFQICGQRPNYYSAEGDSKVTAVVMKLSLLPDTG